MFSKNKSPLIYCFATFGFVYLDFTVSKVGLREKLRHKNVNKATFQVIFDAHVNKMNGSISYAHVPIANLDFGTNLIFILI